MKRREFLKTTGGAGLLAGTGAGSLLVNLSAFGEKPNLSNVEARYYKKHPDREIECELCPRTCKLGDRERGYCGVRENREGTYTTLVYGKACAIHNDPIEKKPLFHFFPGSSALSVATAGCNVNCKFCQNWEISQVRPEQVRHVDLAPETAVTSAQKLGCRVIAFTYTEPVVFFEYMYDTSVAARNHRIKTAVITGGYISPEPLKDLAEVVDSIKIDLKAFSQNFYAEYVRGNLQPVLDAIKIVAQSKAWLEIVYLVIPTLNDSTKEIQSMCRWIRDEVGPDIPLHFSRFYPMYLLKNLPPTPLSTLEKVRAAAIEEGLHYVYIGNVPGHEAESTFCPACQRLVIQRIGYQVKKVNLKDGRCLFCGTPIPGIWT